MVVARYGVISEIPPHHRLQPLQGVRDGLVHALLQLHLDFFQLGRHALPDGLSLDHEEARLLARPTDVSETQKVEGLRFSLATFLPALGGVTPKLNQARFLWMQLQSEFPQPFPQLHQEPLGFFLVLESQHSVVRVADDNHTARRFLPPPLVYPEVEYIMQVEIGQKRRNHRPLRSPLLCLVPPTLLHHARLQPFLDQADDPPVANSVLDKLDHPRMFDLIEKCPDIQVEHPAHLLACDSDVERVQRIVLAPPWPESIRKTQKVLFPDLVEDRPYRVLYDFVFQCRDSQWSLPSIVFQDPDSP